MPLGKVVSYDSETGIVVIKPDGDNLPEVRTLDAPQIHLPNAPKPGDAVTFLVSYLEGKPTAFRVRDASYANVP